MLSLVVGSRNRDKAREIAALLDGLPLRVRSLAEWPDAPDVDETESTFAGNAALKAVACARVTGELALADDSGLCVDALGGEPGVYSARYAGPGCTYADNNRKLLAALRDVAPPQRTAHFISVIALAAPDGTVRFTVEGRVDGVIADAPRGEAGFGYDPVFVYPPLNRTFAELDPAAKNRVSHRGRALAAFRERLLAMLAAS